MKYQYASDSHSHSNCSPDGRDSVINMCKRALEIGLYYYTLTDHCECNAYRKDSFDISAQKANKEMAAAQTSLLGKLRFLRGIELGQATQDMDAAEDVLSKFNYDFVLGSIHNIRGFEDFYFIDYESCNVEYVEKLLGKYFSELLELIAWGKFDALSHLTYPLRYIPEKFGDLTHHHTLIDKIFRELIQKQIALELNVSGIRKGLGTYPNKDLLARYRELGGKLVTLGSDAHFAEYVGSGIDEGMDLLKQVGFDAFTVFVKHEPVQLPLI